VPFYGAVVACADDRPVRELIPRVARRVIAYGFADSDAGIAEVVGHGMSLEAFGSRCRISRRRDGDRVVGELRLRVPGRHNLLNALGATTVGLELGVPFDRIAAALAEFRGAERRFQLRGEEKGVMVVDDYGHHPTEIAAVIAAARAGIDRRVVVVFQPHRYSRTQQLMTEFGTALSAADEIVLTDIYSAGESPIAGVTIDALASTVRAAARGPVHLVAALDEVPAAVAALVRDGDLVLTMGAGSIGTTADRILAALRGSEKGSRQKP
jgi:UDP-N-acetylmuramate--alanine ligase